MQTDDHNRTPDNLHPADVNGGDALERLRPHPAHPSTEAGARRTDARGPGVELTVVVPTFSERDNIGEVVRRLSSTLQGIEWEVVFVDDDSPDGTAIVAKSIAARDKRVRCIRRVGRRGLSGACVEGILSSAAPVVAVMDADLQHDETILPEMLKAIHEGADLVIGSRYREGGSAAEGLSPIRRWGSQLATRIANTFMGSQVSDPMSGFFMLRREIVEKHAAELAGEGYKLLMDILWTTGKSLVLREVSYSFRERFAGDSKLDALVTFDYLGLLFSKIFGGVLPVRFLMFGAVGVSGIAVHLLVLQYAVSILHLPFAWAQLTAIMVAMTWNFIVNNRLTYRDARLTGWGFARGLLLFYLACSIGSIGNVGVASWIYSFNATAWVAGLAGALMGAVFNYAISSALIWKRK
ncbi:MAG: glycosyltransferase family 2 protein [Rhizobium sp.]|nr:glycosyltransferase family 2 protein [Rhizobium sp.]